MSQELGHGWFKLTYLRGMRSRKKWIKYYNVLFQHNQPFSALEEGPVFRVEVSVKSVWFLVKYVLSSNESALVLTVGGDLIDYCSTFWTQHDLQTN